MLANFTEPLERAIEYENEEFRGHFTPLLVDIEERFEAIIDGLSNITGVMELAGSAASNFDDSGTNALPSAVSEIL